MAEVGSNILDIFVGDKILLKDVDNATGFFKRLKGLMFKSGTWNKGGLLIKRCNWIHTFFMRFPLTVIYLGKDYSVVDVDPYVRPWRFCMPRFKASHIIELKADPKVALSISKGEVFKCIA